MRYKNWSIPYLFSYALFFFARKGYYRKVSKKGIKNIPKGKPVIFAINHQNSLVDPCIVATTTLTPVYFLARSDVFKISFVSKILHSINMMPIFRQKDGDNFKEKNLEIFEKCATILSKNGRIMIFPEGSNNSNNRLRVIKKGIARIALDANLKSKEDVFIVPVGLNYSNKKNKCADLFVNYGEAINVSKIIEEVGETDNENEIFAPVMEILKVRMQNLILHYDNEEFYNLYEFLLFNIRQNKSRFNTILSHNFEIKKEKNVKITNWIKENPTVAKQHLFDSEFIKKECEENKIKPYLLENKKHTLSYSFFVLIVCFPVFLYGSLNNYFPYVLPQKLVLKKIKDTQFHQAVNMIVGALFFSIFWAIQTFLVSIFTDNYIWILYLISLPISGWLSFEYYIKYRRFIGKQKYNSLLKTNVALMKELREKYLKLKEFITYL